MKLKKLSLSQPRVGQMSALCVCWRTAMRIESGEKRRKAVQHNEPAPLPRAQAKPSHHKCQRSACVLQAGGVRAVLQGSRLSVGQSCQRQISPGELRPSALPLRKNIYRSLAACMCDLMRVSETGEQNAARISLPSPVRNRTYNPLGSKTEILGLPNLFPFR